MSLFKKKIEEKVETPPTVSDEIQKLSLFITIVDRDQGNFITNIFEKEGSNAQFINIGEGTANKEIRDILGIDDNVKEIVFSIIRNDCIENVSRELEAFFKISKRNRGVGFSIPMTSLIGMKIYQFLTDK